MCMSDRTGGYTAVWKCGLLDTVLVYKTYLPCVADIRIFPIKTCVRFLAQTGLEYIRYSSYFELKRYTFCLLPFFL